jgi:hypothetical protein
MSYTFQEDGDIPMWVDNEGNEFEGYNFLYSVTQHRRNKKVLKQLLNNWNDVHICINSMLQWDSLSMEQSVVIMSKIHNMFFQQYRLKRDFVKTNLTKNKKKIYKLRNRKIY